MSPSSFNGDDVDGVVAIELIELYAGLAVHLPAQVLNKDSMAIASHFGRQGGPQTSGGTSDYSHFISLSWNKVECPQFRLASNLQTLVAESPRSVPTHYLDVPR